jgi:AraC-like DNA-binding protein/mannose-6-phosphate isomerase-like protein (cupin superfamily)
MHPERLSVPELIAPDAPFQIQHTVLVAPYPLHWHDFYEVALVLSGTGTHVVNGREHLLQPGALFLLTPVDFHHLIPAQGEPLEVYNINFSGEFLDDELRQWLFSDLAYHHHVLPEPYAAYVRVDFTCIWNEKHGNGLGRSRLMRSSLERILLEVARYSLARPQPEAVSRSAIHDALLYLHHNFRAPLKLENVAAQVGLSPTYFSQIFHKVTGSQFQKHLGDLRLRFAASLLLASDLPVTDVCFISGFGNMAHFGRMFRSKYGFSPTQYRQVSLTERTPSNNAGRSTSDRLS